MTVFTSREQRAMIFRSTDNLVSEAQTEQVPGEGERSARLGYVFQDRASASLLREAIVNRELRWVGLADRSAGVADDLVMGLENCVVGHQFKNSGNPQPVGLISLLLGKSLYISDLARSYDRLRKQFAGLPTAIRFFSVHPASKHDRLVKGFKGSTTDAFIKEKQAHPDRSLAVWRKTQWKSVIDQLQAASELDGRSFELFWSNLEIVLGGAASAVLHPTASPKVRDEIEEVAKAIPALIVDAPDRDRWTRSELLAALGWRDPFATKFSHVFPVGEYVQANDVSEAELLRAVNTHSSGYIAVLGSPGTGKSTLLQTVLRDTSTARVVRYLAFVPGRAQGQGRGEAENLYVDLNAGLSDTGLKPPSVKSERLADLQSNFQVLLSQASDRFRKEGTRFIIVVDGLDHVPREEKPEYSLLRSLPLPRSLPEGVLIVLGSQTLDLPDMPPAVRDEAAGPDRRINMAPLSEGATARLANLLGLPQSIEPSEVHAVADGHPLVTRYLIKRLSTCDEEDQLGLLDGQFGFGGDLEDIYTSAWRGISNLPNGLEVARVLSLVGFAEGAIEPQCLAKATSEGAVESTFGSASHLLSISDAGWTAFHNSFRVFLQTRSIKKFGTIDQDYASPKIFERLANLTSNASVLSPQRWLQFRYLYKARVHGKALKLAGRKFFIDQYCRGRSPSELLDDVKDAVRALSMKPNPTKLFELLLTWDEIDRRADVMENAAALPEAYVAIGDLQGAVQTLSDGYQEGKQWTVVDSLLADGKVEEARRIFENYSPFRSALGPTSDFASRDIQQVALPWAKRAITFLNAEQLKRLTSQVVSTTNLSGPPIDTEQGHAQLLLKLQVARAYASADPDTHLANLARDWDVSDENYPLLLLEAAFAAKDDDQRVLRLLSEAADHPETQNLHISWLLDATRYAARMNERELALKFLAHAPLEGLDAEDVVYRTEARLSAGKYLTKGIALRTWLAVPLSELGVPEERLIQGVQHHLVSIAKAIGLAQTTRPLANSSVKRTIKAALRFLALERSVGDEDRFGDFQLKSLSETVLQAVFALAETASLEPGFVAASADELIAREKARFRWWPRFRRELALRTYQVDGDASAARTRLEASQEAIDPSDPYGRVEQATELAIAFSRIGDLGRAKRILSELRRDALAVVRPAKKDGQYELWNDLLVKADGQEPNQRAARAKLVLRLIDGLADSEGSNMGPRIVRQVSYEASVDSARSAWSIASWAARTGANGWDGIVDATLRGLVNRGSFSSKALLTIWSHLCLPWYDEPHASTGELGSFLSELIKEANQAEVDQLECAAAAAIGERSRPELRLSLLGVLEAAAIDRGNGTHANSEKQRWSDAHLEKTKADPENRSYERITQLSDIREAIKAERDYFAQNDKRSYRSTGLSSGLEKAIVRVLASASWVSARKFAEEEPELAKTQDIIEALVGAALRAGDRSYAADIATPMLSNDETGWDWMSGRGRMRMHKMRHLLGKADAHEAARQDFFDDMLASRYGVRSVLWEVADIFPLLFEDINWVELWGRLEAQIRSMHDFKVGRPVDDLCGELNDLDLVVALLVRAISLEAIPVRDEAILCAQQLRANGFHAEFCGVVTRLLAGENESNLLGLYLLSESREDGAVASEFSERIQALCEHADSGVANAALFLASFWGVDVALDRQQFSAFYGLELPRKESPSGRTLSDQRTRSLVVDDYLAWTEEWTTVVKWIAEWSDVSQQHVRYRVGQLISDWGGVKEFGHPASKDLEQRLSRIDLKLVYRRPQANATISALRHVAGELWRAGRLPTEALNLVLFDLHSSIPGARLPNFSQRPIDLLLPQQPDRIWGSDKENWLESVPGDLKCPKTKSEEVILAEYYKATKQEFRASVIAERFSAHGFTDGPFATLEGAVASLPTSAFLTNHIEFYDQETCHPAHTSCFSSHNAISPIEKLLVLCPFKAKEIGWTQDRWRPDLYRDSQGVETARTIVWRDGFKQQLGEEASFASGQRIVLSKTGRRKFEDTFGAVSLEHIAWRHVQRSEDEGGSESRSASSSAYRNDLR